MKQLSSIKRAVQRAPIKFGHSAAKAGRSAKAMASSALSGVSHAFQRRDVTQIETSDKLSSPTSWSNIDGVVNPVYEGETMYYPNKLRNSFESERSTIDKRPAKSSFTRASLLAELNALDAD